MGRFFFNMVASGSSGNCSIIYDDQDCLIVDFGISYRSLKNRLEILGKHLDSANLFISHEHTDHTSGIPVLRKKLKLDIYSRQGTIDSLGLQDAFSIGTDTVIGDFRIKTVDVSHDAAEPVAYFISSGKRKISIISDLGYVNDEVIEAARGSDILAFEANHDRRMLLEGSYSPPLKTRIDSRHGHLSNMQSAEAIAKVCKPDSAIVLIHLSQENNRPEVASDTVKTYLSGTGVSYASMETATQARGSQHYALTRDSEAPAKMIV